MSQQHMYPSSSGEELQVENKIILLYLIDKMDIPMSNSQIVQFALEENYMNVYTVQEYLSEMVTKGYLDKSYENNTTRYTITDEGAATLEIFLKHVPMSIRNRIQKYAHENRKTIKQDFEINANYFYDHNNNEYVVKCGIYDDELMLMEINLSVVSKEQAMGISKNWRANVNSLYSQIFSILVNKGHEKDNLDDTTEHREHDD